MHTILSSGLTRTAGARVHDHQKGAEKLGGAGFYSKFVSKQLKGKEPSDFGGVYFESLEWYLALGFDFKADSSKVASLLYWSNDTLQCMQRSKSWNGATQGAESKGHWCAYLIELVYDLCIDVNQNVSRGPGFEGPLGVTSLE